jgi:hypothetical protein
MITIAGDEGIHKLIWYYVRGVFFDNINIVVVDAANRFDPYLISRLCVNMQITPYNILEKIFIARAFTPFQMLKLLEKVYGFQQADKKFIFILLGLTKLLDDDNIPSRHARKVLKKSLSYLIKMKHSIVTVNNFDRRGFLKVVERESDIFIEDNHILKPENFKKGAKKIWAGQLHLLHTF